MKKKKIIVSSILYAVIAIIVVALIVGNVIAMQFSPVISVFFGHEIQKIETVEDDADIDTEYYKSSYTSLKDLRAYEEELSLKIQSEGAVLLRNEQNALPLAKNANVTLMGSGAGSGFQYGGAGSGSIDTKNTPTLSEAFVNAGYGVNPNSCNTSYSAADFTGYTDAGIIVIARSGAEGSDVKTGSLSFTASELALIDSANLYCNKVIVLLNTMNAMELGPIESAEHKVDACVWIGAGGQMGVKAIPYILNGEMMPSGRLVDTYVYDNGSSPAMQNFGTQSINGVSRKSYVSYAEGIYVGYRYYETRYADVVLGQGNAGTYDYTEQVQFPFGFGLSYSAFEYTNYNMTETGENFVFTVTVKNTSATTDKAVVEIYMQSPYTDYDKQHGVEKSAVELVGFEKTSALSQNQSETVTITVAKENMRSWDTTANNGKGGYIVENDAYYFAFGTDAHDALNNILAAQGKTTADGMDYNGNSAFVSSYTPEKFDSTTYNVGADGKQIENQFTKTDLGYYISNYTYLTRSDWTGSFPAAATAIDASSEMQNDLQNGITTDYFVEDPDATMPTMNTVSEEYGLLTLASMIGIEYDSKYWDALLDQMSFEDMSTLIRIGGYQTQLISSVNKPATIDKDGPAGISATLVGGAGCFGFPIEMVLASTWNIDLAEEMGECIGEDSLYSGTNGWYAPAMNTHRTPYAGRNFEYYSEDGFLGGQFGAATVIGAQSKGTYCYMKHFALNDQESGRSGLPTFCNEQALREIYLRPFELTVREGNCHAVMSAMNCIGTTWAGAHKGLMTYTLRNEWGFEGMAITDQASGGNSYMNITGGLCAGHDLWLNSSTTAWDLSNYQNNATIVTAMRQATKNILFTVANSNAMNGVAPNSRIIAVMPLWQIWLIILDVVVGLAAVVGIFFITRSLLKSKKQVKADSEPDVGETK